MLACVLISDSTFSVMLRTFFLIPSHGQIFILFKFVLHPSKDSVSFSGDGIHNVTPWHRLKVLGRIHLLEKCLRWLVWKNGGFGTLVSSRVVDDLSWLVLDNQFTMSNYSVGYFDLLACIFVMSRDDGSIACICFLFFPGLGNAIIRTVFKYGRTSIVFEDCGSIFE